MIQALRRAAVALALAALAGCATTSAPPSATPPRLVVLIPIDGFPQRQLVDYRDQFVADGFRRFLDRGAWFSDALQGHSLTDTASGHSVMLTGAYPHRSGIISNEWRDPVTFLQQYCTADPEYKYLGGNPTKRLDGTSPRNMKVETVGDVLRRANDKSRVLAVSLLDRAAILPAGHRGTAYMYQAQTGQFASSSYYMAEHPEWVTKFNAAKPADRFFHAQWKPLLEDAAYARSLPDEQPFYAKGGKLPKVIGEAMQAPGPGFYDELRSSPFHDELVLEFARAAMAAEHLGQDDIPDILIVSLKAHDFINHAWSAESRLSQDHTLRLDRLLAAFFQHLDATLGKDAWLAVLTADHGFTPAPEASAAKGLDAKRARLFPSLAGMNAELEKIFGPGKWIQGFSADTLVIDKALAKKGGVDISRVAEEARRLLLREPVIEAAYTRAEMMSGSRSGSPWFERMERSFHPERSGDVQYVIKRYWSLSTQAGTHGAPHPEDSNVPIAFYGPTWISAGRNDTRVETVDIAPTLARILGIAAPAAAEGKVLPVLKH